MNKLIATYLCSTCEDRKVKPCRQDVYEGSKLLPCPTGRPSDWKPITVKPK